MKYSQRLAGFALSTGLSALLLAGCGTTGSTVNFPVQPSQTVFRQSVVIDWNQAMLSALRNSPPRPTVNCRAMFMVHCAIFDAWSAYDSKAVGPATGSSLKRPAAEQTQANKAQAVSYAAYRVLTTLYPTFETQTGTFRNTLTSLGYSADAAFVNSTDPTQPAGVGNLAAQAVINDRANDGSNAANNFQDTTSATYPTLYAPLNSANPAAPNYPGKPAFNPAHWQPLRVPTGTVTGADGYPVADPNVPGSFNDQVFLTPHWGAVKSFAMTSGSQFRPQAPPQPNSTAPYVDGLGVTTTNDAAYNRQADEILKLNQDLTDAHKCIAEYWADGPTSTTPPGHWNEFAQDISFRDRFSLDQDVFLFFALNGGMLDASIACWESKRNYDFIRPISLIQNRFFGQTIQGWGGPGQGTISLLGQNWRPFQSLTFVTPGFAEYTSGHSTFSACGAEVLTEVSGSTRLYDGVTVLPADRNQDGRGDFLGQYIFPTRSLKIDPTIPAAPVTLQWATLQDAADEAGFSRRYGGIHFQDGDLFGRVAGKNVAVQAVARARAYRDGTVTP